MHDVIREEGGRGQKKDRLVREAGTGRDKGEFFVYFVFKEFNVDTCGNGEHHLRIMYRERSLYELQNRVP